MAHVLAKQGKPFTNGELIKLCLITAAGAMCPKKINLLRIISLLVRTVVQRVEDIGSNIHSQLKNEANYFEWFSLALMN